MATKKKKRRGEKKLVCSDCGLKFHFKCQLNFHQLVHTGEKPYNCKDCNKSFNTPYSLRTHRYIHSDEKPFKCSYCDYACRDSSTLRKHQHRHLGLVKDYKCKICTKSYVHEEKLTAHLKTHQKTDFTKLPCEHCDKTFQSRTTLNGHIKNVHLRMKECSCPICGKKLKNKAYLATHLITHVDERPYICAYAGCNKSYKDSSTLYKHKILHTPEKQFPCKSCGRLFSRRVRLQRHEIVHHGKMAQIVCKYCKNRFLSKNYLIKHINQKHSQFRERYICDVCNFTSFNKSSLVKHIKYGHGNEDDTQCKVCNFVFKRNVYLQIHYQRAHNIVYKTKRKYRTPQFIEIKEEPVDVKDDTSKDIFCRNIVIEIPVELESYTEPSDLQSSNADSDRLQSRSFLSSITEDAFEKFYDENIQRVTSKRKVKAFNTLYRVDAQSKQRALKSLEKQIAEAGKKGIEGEEERRQIYNKYLKYLSPSEKGLPKVNKVSNIVKTAIDEDGKEHEKGRSRKVKGKRNTDPSNEEKSNEEEELNNENEEHDKIPSKKRNRRPNTGPSRIKEKSDDEDVSSDDEERKIKRPLRKRTRRFNTQIWQIDEMSDDDEEYGNSEDEELEKRQVKKGKVIFNTHQCYVCFKLYETKEKLLEHCKDHFDLCFERSLKKCPLCDYVSQKYLPRHLRTVHGIKIKMPYTIHDKKHDDDGSRYYLEVNNPKVPKIDIIPSIKNLNRIASNNIDKRNREEKNRTMVKDKLVKKGKEWIVEKETLKYDDSLIPKFDTEDLKKVKCGDSEVYFDTLKKLYKISKRDGKQMLFPCQNCEKVCQNMSALKLHHRKHDPDAKPFRKKVWKHKLKGEVEKIPKRIEITTRSDYKTAKPKPIKNNHRCDPELLEFYKNNIRGSNIEFWQFLKIFNKMDRDKINDFKDLKGKYEYGIDHNLKDGDANFDDEETNEVSRKTNKKVNKNNRTVGKSSKKVIRNAKTTRRYKQTLQKHQKLNARQ